MRRVMPAERRPSNWLVLQRPAVVGTVELCIPKLRKGSFFPEFWSHAGWPRRR
jgi:hypothetical protein